jgi:hypothetical protein
MSEAFAEHDAPVVRAGEDAIRNEDVNLSS